MTKQKFDAILTAYIEQEQDYIKEHEQIKDILKPLEGKPINGRTLNDKRLNGFKFVNQYGMFHIYGKYSHLIGYENSENTISVDGRDAGVDETGLTIPKHRGFKYMDACNGSAAQERIDKIKAIDHAKAFDVFQKIETHFNELRRLFGTVENEGLGSFDFPAYYSVLSQIYEPKNGDLKLTDFYFIREGK
jgi:hypothetical protein